MNFCAARHAKQVQQYIADLRPVFQPQAVFSDESPWFREPFEPCPGDTVKIRIRTLKNNVESIYLVANEKRRQMQLAETRSGFDYYEASLPVGREKISYFFELRSGHMVAFYNKQGITRDLAERNAFRIHPDFSTPEWARGAVMYQIFTDRFRRGNPNNDVKTGEYAYLGSLVQHVDDWNKAPDAMDVRNFYGGDLEGVEEKLDYLHNLGVEVIYFNPIFLSPSNHKYDIQDYDHIDPHYARVVRDDGGLLSEGDLDNRHATRYIRRVTDPENLAASDEYFAHLTHEIHKRGMRVILDGVFNHCGSFNKWLDRERIYENEDGYEKGAFVSEHSPYRTFFRFNNEHAWPYNEYYDGWWGHETLPKLNYEDSPKLVDYILQIAKKWVSPPYNVDGWRLDVAADLGRTSEYNHTFWKLFRKAVREANPEAIILAEHYGESYDWLQGDEWDTVMNYDAFMEPVSWFLTGMEKHSDQYREDLIGNGEAFINTMRYHMASFMGGSLLCAMNELDNHDHSRFLTRTNHYVGRVGTLGTAAAGENILPPVMREAVLIQMTFPGAPTIYYGDEAGVVGFTDPDNRRTYPWGREDLDMLCYYREAVLLHKRWECLKTGALQLIEGGRHYISYARFTDSEEIIVVVNSHCEQIDVEIPVWIAGVERSGRTILEQIFVTDGDGFSLDRSEQAVEDGILKRTMQPYEAAAFLLKK